MEVINQCKAFLSNFEVKQILESNQEVQNKLKKKKVNKKTIQEDVNIATVTWETLKYLNDTRWLYNVKKNLSAKGYLIFTNVVVICLDL